MEQKKKLDWKSALLIIMTGLMILSYFKIHSLKDDISNLENRISNMTGDLNAIHNEVSKIYSNVDEQMKKQASILSEVDYTLGKLNTATNCVDVEIRVVPKNLTDDMKLSVQCGQENAVFTRSGSEFTAVLPVNLFLDYESFPLLSIETGGTVSTESLEDVDVTYLCYRYLPVIYVNMGHSTTLKDGVLEIDGHFHVDGKPGSPDVAAEFVNYTFVIEKNGKEIDRKDITEKVSDSSYDGQFKASYEAIEGDVVAVYLEAEDSLGYIHKALAFHWYEKDGATAEYAVAVDSREQIYDKNGNLLNGNG